MSGFYREFTSLSADGLSLYGVDYSPATPQGTVVCLHGLTRNSRDFTQLAQHLVSRYRVLAPDLRGRGFSQWDANIQNYHAKVYVNDVLKLMTDVGAGRVAVIGTSLGGILAMLLAASSPDRIAGIVVNDIGPELAKEGVDRIASYVGVREAPVTWAGAVAQLKASYAQAYPDFSEAEWETFAKACYRERDGRVVADYDPLIGDAMRASSGHKFDLWDLWKGLKVPALAVRGALSDLLSAETFERMQTEMPALERVAVVNRGHTPLLTEPHVLAAIDRFLARVFGKEKR